MWFLNKHVVFNQIIKQTCGPRHQQGVTKDQPPLVQIARHCDETAHGKLEIHPSLTVILTFSSNEHNKWQ